MDKKFKLQNHESAFCHVVVSTDKNSVALVSYETQVINLLKRKSGWYLYCSSNYSRSTIRQMAWFLKDFNVGVTYHEIRDALKAAIKRNRDKDKMYDKMTSAERFEFNKHYRIYYEEYAVLKCAYDSAIDKRVQEYLEDGKPFVKYSGHPNYVYYEYGYSNFNALSLK